MSSKRRQIADSIVQQIGANVPELKLVNFDKIKILAEDFQDWEIPACQLIDNYEQNQHQIRRGLRSWNLALEVVIGPTETAQVSQAALWDLVEKIEQAIFVDPRFGLNFVVHAKLLGTETDLHLLEPFYTARIDLAIDYYQPLVGEC